MLPISCEKKHRVIPVSTILVILSCAAVFYAQGTGIPHTGLKPLELAYALFHPVQSGREAIVNVLTSFFLHANLFHLVSNMWFLWIFGAAVESTVGIIPFAVYYAASGILSMLIQATSDPLSPIPIVGASGAIAGVMGMHCILSPLSRVLVWLPPIFFCRVPAFLFLALWFSIQYVNIIRPAPSGAGVAWWAHAGGFIAGVLFGVGIRAGLLPGKKSLRREKRG